MILGRITRNRAPDGEIHSVTPFFTTADDTICSTYPPSPIITHLSPSRISISPSLSLSALPLSPHLSLVVSRPAGPHEAEVGHQAVHQALALQVPDLHRRLGRGAQPVAVGREAQRVDDVARVQGVEPLALGQVPQHGGAVLAAGRAQGAVRGDGDGIDVASVAEEVLPQLAVGQVPHLDGLKRREARVEKRRE